MQNFHVKISFFVREIGREVDIFQYFLENSNLTVFMVTRGRLASLASLSSGLNIS